uniref:Uncharacterized protein n=1 Tax=Oryza barthii TaxID=65489 RepID=A0A0D3FJC6_9ORYZ
METAKDAGIWEVLLLRYFDLQVIRIVEEFFVTREKNVCEKAAPWPLAAMIRAFSMLHNRMLADPSFLFKVGTEGFMDTAITPSFHSLILHSSSDDIFVIPKE